MNWISSAHLSPSLAFDPSLWCALRSTRSLCNHNLSTENEQVILIKSGIYTTGTIECAMECSQLWMLNSSFPEAQPNCVFDFDSKHVPLAKTSCVLCGAGNELVMVFEANWKSYRTKAKSGFFEIDLDNGTNYISANPNWILCCAQLYSDQVNSYLCMPSLSN